ncbi:MAG: hypothetical protein ACRDJV_04310 [Actinomycetota bacterium]
MTTPPPTSAPIYAWAGAARAAGAVIALGYLLGLAPGPVVAVIGGLGLITFGRALTADRLDGAFLGASLAVLSGVLGVAALRWGALDLDGIRGVQAFFGPTVLVEPEAAAVAAWVAAVCGVVAVGLWIGPPPRLQSLSVAPWALDAVMGAFAIVTAYWGEGVIGWGGGSGPVGEGVVRWALAIAITGAAAACIAWTGARIGPRLRWLVLAGAGAAVLGAAIATASAVRGVV